MQRLIKEYEEQYDEIVGKRNKQSEELKILRKDNINLHREQNRLHVIIKENSKQDEMAQELTKMLSIKEKNIEELNRSVGNLNEKITDKDEQICALRETIKRLENEIVKYDSIFEEMSQESTALIEALAKELGNEEHVWSGMDSKERKDSIVPILKKRRCSLKDDFQRFAQHLTHSTESSSSLPSVDELQIKLHDDFNVVAAGCRQALSHVEKTEKSVKTIQQNLEGMLLGKRPEGDFSTSVSDDKQSRREKQHNTRESTSNKRRVNWATGDRTRKVEIVDEMNPCEREFNERVNTLCEESHRAQVKLHDLETVLKDRVETRYREETGLEREGHSCKTMKRNYQSSTQDSYK